ncbi:MAG TPA: tetratricopeptide repeat protein [Candidatus Deferrimicrobium sp.]|nr:tetratricopeptide repeat protein [Candidatus Deferrimicrobium sp.]
MGFLTKNKENESKKFINNGKKYLNQGRVKEAISEFEKSLDNSPNYEAFFNLGSCYMMLGNYQKTIYYYELALEFSPVNSKALTYSSLGLAYSQINEKEKALEYCKKAVEIDPSSSLLWTNLGGLYHRFGASEKALECHQKAAEFTSNKLKPEDALVCYNLAVSNLEEGEVEKAKECLKRAFIAGGKMNLADPDEWVSVGNDLIQKDKDMAKLCFTIALDVDSKCVDAWNNLGGINCELGMIKEAISCYKKAMKIRPSDPRILFNLSNIYVMQNDWNEAIIYLEKFTKMDRSMQLAWRNLGIGYLKFDLISDAIPCLKKAVLLNPSDKMAWRCLGISYQKTGETLKAWECLKKSDIFY